MKKLLFGLLAVTVFSVSPLVFAFEENRNPLHDIHYAAADLSGTYANTFGGGDPRISPFGRYVVDVETGDPNWGGWRPTSTVIVLQDLATGLTKQIIEKNDAYRYLDPQVSDNGFVSYVRTPSGYYSNLASHEVFLFDPETNLSQRLDRNCPSTTPVPGATVTTSAGNDLVYNPRRDTAISGDGRFIAYENTCFADHESGQTTDIYLYDRIENTTSLLHSGFGARAAVWMSTSGRVVKYRTPETSNQQRETVILHLDQVTGETGEEESIDCLDQDGDGWGGVRLSGNSCRIDNFEIDVPACDYVAAVSSNGARTCAFSRADALSTADGDCTNWSRVGSDCRADYDEHRARIIDDYRSRTATLIASETDRDPINTTMENSGDCDYSNANFYGGWGWNDATQSSCPPVEMIVSACDYTNAATFNGWGWNPETNESCLPVDNDNTDIQTVASTCDYSNAPSFGGWGWDPVSRESCAPAGDSNAQTESQNPVCLDSDGDGWGWDGSNSCRIN